MLAQLAARLRARGEGGGGHTGGEGGGEGGPVLVDDDCLVSFPLERFGWGRRRADFVVGHVAVGSCGIIWERDGYICRMPKD